MYWDQGHTSDNGNFIMAQKIFEIAHPIVLDNSSEIINEVVPSKSIEIGNKESIQFGSWKDFFSYYKTPIMVSQILEEISGNKSCRYDC